MARSQSGSRIKHVPQRTCIACRQVAGKRELIRVVRTTDGVEIDVSRKKNGRGAYIHPYQSCWRIVLERRQLDRALRTRLKEEEIDTLQRYMQTLAEAGELDKGE